MKKRKGAKKPPTKPTLASRRPRPIYVWSGGVRHVVHPTVNPFTGETSASIVLHVKMVSVRPPRPHRPRGRPT